MHRQGQTPHVRACCVCCVINYSFELILCSEHTIDRPARLFQNKSRRHATHHFELRLFVRPSPWAFMSQSIVFAIAAMVCYGLSDFIYKQAAAAGIRADHFLMAQGWFFCPLVVLYALATHTLVLDPAALWGLLAGAFIFIAFYYFIRSLAAGSVSTNASIFRLNFIITVMLVIALRAPRPRKRTLRGRSRMSALGHKRTHADVGLTTSIAGFLPVVDVGRRASERSHHGPPRAAFSPRR
jgi:hypothetical protein